MEFLGPFELFLHAENPPLPVLVRTALIHVQFETIHPFLDGNGRLGAYSARCRSRFRDEGDSDSGRMPITIPAGSR
jgi:hypothetical protein